eukprot:2587089-Pyramimonas_sp.AAC.1
MLSGWVSSKTHSNVLNHSVKRITPVPKQLWGRSFGIAIQQQDQLLDVIGLYFPPRVPKKGQKGQL